MVRVEIQPFHASLRTMATTYSKLKELITLRVSMSDMHSQILHAMKGLYQNDINSARRYEQITTIGQLLKVLELRDVLSEENILPLQVLAQRLPDNMEVMNSITCYEPNPGLKQNINQYGTNLEQQNGRLMTFKSLVEDCVSLTCNLLYKNGIHSKKQCDVKIKERTAWRLANSESFSKLKESAMVVTLSKLLMILILQQIVTSIEDVQLFLVALICVAAVFFRSALNSLIEDHQHYQIIDGKITDGVISLYGHNLSLIYHPYYLMRAIRKKYLTKKDDGKTRKWRVGIDACKTVSFFDKLLDSRWLGIGTRKKNLTRIVTKTSRHRAFSRYGMRKQKMNKFVHQNGQQTETYVHRFKKLQGLWQFLKSNNLIKCIDYFYSDPIENFFSQMHDDNFRNNEAKAFDIVVKKLKKYVSKRIQLLFILFIINIVLFVTLILVLIIH
ncbi:uncharacterized protein LOC134665997 isoform X1 [Cydia fagiglandana]|uniref:uncharacterized protein LOC134665997 isoform X1 n=1 Tax=Cydia fagiglandana TaxID=1458189 RepID=UPI002FEE5605